MLHQLLFCLLGKPGTIIKQTNGQFHVDRSLNLFLQPQLNLVDEIVGIGSQFLQLQKLILKQIVGLDEGYGEQSSVYRKAVASGIQIIMRQYTENILGIQSQFLNNRHFTISSIRAQLSPFFHIFQVLIALMKKIQGRRGGIIVDILKETININNLTVQQHLQRVFEEPCKVFINQIKSWILYGKIIDNGGEFFVHKVASDAVQKSKLPGRSHIEITDWDMYTLEINLVPQSLISAQTAQKILFIGKSVKILRSLEESQNLSKKQLQQKVKELQSKQFNVVQFDGVIEQIRHKIAGSMIEIIMGQQKLMYQLERINGYYLMRKGDFYHLFLEECRGIQNILQRQKAQKRINEKYLQNTFIKLNSFEDSKVISFELKSLGFLYVGFRNTNQLCLVGNLNLIDSKSIRFNGLGALWHKTKQVLDNNFNMVFSFCFKRIVPKKVKYPENTWTKSSLNLVIHNSKEITSRVHDAPITLESIGQYVCVRFGVQENQTTSQTRSFVHILSMSSKKKIKEDLIAEMFITQKKPINLIDDRPHQITVTYSDGILRVAVSRQGLEFNSLKTQIKLSQYVNLQMGRGYVGFIPQLETNILAQIDQWQMVCKAHNHSGNHWSDLCLNYKVAWPINLVLTPDLLESFSRINKFLLPIRQTQINLENIWVRFPKHPKKYKQKQVHSMNRKMGVYRWKLSLLINSLWGYFQADVTQTTWNKLKDAANKTDDFEELRMMINKYVKAIGTMYFFNVPNIQKSIHDIVRHGKQFVNYFNKLQRQQIENEETQLEYLQNDFDEIAKNFYQLLKDWSKINSSQYLYHLIQRMESAVKITTQ